MGGKTSTSTAQTTIPPEVLARYNSVNTQAQNVAATPFQQYSTDPSAFVAPLTATQQAGVANTNAASGMAQPYFNSATGFALAGSGAVNPSAIDAGTINNYMNPYLNTVLGSTEALINQQNQQQQAGQLGNAITSGAFGGDRAGIAAATLAGQQQLAAGQTYSGIASDAYTQALAAAQQQQGVNLAAQQANRAALQQTGETMAGLGTGAQAAALQGAQAQLGAGQVGQQTQQAGLTALYNQFLQQQSYPFQVAQFLANIAEGTGALSGSTTTTTQPQSIFSDERLKEDMAPIGKGFDGANIYRFRYKGDPTTRIGFSAQETERRHPEAVIETPGGFKAVDYGQATEEAAQRGGFANAANDNDDDDLGFRRARQGGGYSGYSGTGGVQAPAGVNPYDIAMLLQAQQGMYAPYNQSGLYGNAASGQPHGGSSYVPAANLPIAHLASPAPPQQRQENALQDASELASTEQNISKAVPDVQKGWNTLTGHKALPPSDPAADAAATDVGNLMSDTPMDITAMVPSAHGGFRMARQYGGGQGDLSDPQNDDPYAPKGPGLDIPTQQQKIDPLNAPKPPGQGPSGFSQALGAGSEMANIGMAAAKFLPMILALQRGGRVAKQGGGDFTDQSDDTGDISQSGQALGHLGRDLWNAGAAVVHGLTPVPDTSTAATVGRGTSDPTSATAGPAPKAPDLGAFTARVTGMPSLAQKPPASPGVTASLPFQDPDAPAVGNAPAAAPTRVGPTDVNQGPQATSLRNWGVRGTPPQQVAVQRAQAAGAQVGAQHAHHDRAGGTYRPQSAAPPTLTPPPMPPTLTPPPMLAADAASGMPSSVNVPGFGNAGATSAAVSGTPTMPDIGGFSRAGMPPVAATPAATAGTPTAAIAPDGTVPRPVQHIGGPPLPTVDAAGNPVTPGAVQHDPGAGFLPANQAGQAGGAGGAGGAPGGGGFGGMLGGIGHAILGLGGGVAHLLGYQGNGQWNMDRLVPFLNAIGVAGSVPTVHPFVALAAGLRGYGQGYMQQKQQEAELTASATSSLSAQQAMLPQWMQKAGAVVRTGPGKPGQRTWTAGNQTYHIEGLSESMPGATQPAAPGTPTSGTQTAAPGLQTPQDQGGITWDPNTNSYAIQGGAGTDAYMAQHWGYQPGADATGNILNMRMANPTQFDSMDADARNSANARMAQAGDLGDLAQQNSLYDELGVALNRFSDKGFLGSGDKEEDRMALANWYQMIRKNVFNQDPDPSVNSSLTNDQLVGKIRGLLGGDIAHNFGNKAEASAAIYRSIMPGANMTKEAANTNLAQLLTQNRRAQDFAQYRQWYEGKYHTDIGLEQGFTRDIEPRYIPEQRALIRAFSRGTNEKAPTAVEALRQHPEARDRFDKALSPSLSRYFPGQVLQ